MLGCLYENSELKYNFGADISQTMLKVFSNDMGVFVGVIHSFHVLAESCHICS